MKIPGKDYFSNNEVLFIGYSSKPASFAQRVYDAFVKSGIKVYPVNVKKSPAYNVKVYNSLDELPKVPVCAYILLNSDNTAKAVESLKGSGVRKVMFQSSKTVDESTLNACREMNMEVSVVCPMMILSNSFPHNIHRFFEGLKK